MTSEVAGTYRAALAALGGQADHRDVEQALLAAGWTPCGAGDWAIALRSPDGTAAARISPFDPTGRYSAALYREAAHTRQVPALFAHRRLTGGGDLQLLEWLRPVPEDEAVAFRRAITRRAPEVADLVDVVRRVHDRDPPGCLRALGARGAGGAARRSGVSRRPQGRRSVLWPRRSQELSVT